MNSATTKYFRKNFLIFTLAGFSLAFFLVLFNFVLAILKTYEYEVVAMVGTLSRLGDISPEMLDQLMKGAQAYDYDKGLLFLTENGYGKGAFVRLLQLDNWKIITFLFFFILLIAALCACILFYDKNHRVFLRSMKKRVLYLWTAGKPKFDIIYSTDKDADGLISAIDYGMLLHRSSLLQGRKERKKVYSFMEDVSHQLKTPLALMRIYLERIEMEQVSDNVQDKLKKCELNIEKMSSLISYLLQIGKLDAGKVKMERKLQPIDSFLIAIINDLTCLAQKKRVEIELVCHENFKFYFDEFWLREALENLLKNSIEHSPVNSRITVKVEENKRGCVIKLIDCGTGIEPGNLSHIFERFHQGSRQKDQSNGLGLTIARKVMQCHFGTLKVRNNPDAGVTFSAFLPYVQGKETYN